MCRNKASEVPWLGKPLRRLSPMPQRGKTVTKKAYSEVSLKQAEQQLRDSLSHHIGLWIEANCDGNIFWADAYFAPETERRMAEAAWMVYLSSRDGQRFLEEQK